MRLRGGEGGPDLGAVHVPLGGERGESKVGRVYVETSRTHGAATAHLKVMKRKVRFGKILLEDKCQKLDLNIGVTIVYGIDLECQAPHLSGERAELQLLSCSAHPQLLPQMSHLQRISIKY